MWFLRDVRVTLRMLLKTPVAAVAAVTTLALAVGATSALFGIVDTVLLRSLPYREADRLVAIWGTDRNSSDSLFQPSVADLLRAKQLVPSSFVERWRKSSTSFERIAAYQAGLMSAGVVDPERLYSGFVTADFFSCLSAEPILGRTFAASDMVPGADNVVVLGGGAWRRSFAADPQIVGKTVTLDRSSYTVIGVMPDRFEAILPNLSPEIGAWVPISRAYRRGRNWALSTAIGRLKPGVSLKEAQAEMSAIATNLAREGRPFEGHGVNLVGLRDQVTGDARPALLTEFGLAACVLLIACANLAGLTLARATSRERELGIRSALGASRSAMLGHVFTECML